MLLLFFGYKSNSTDHFVRRRARPSICLLHQSVRWEFIKENKKVRKKENKHAFDQATKKTIKIKESFKNKNINQFYFQPLIIVSVICRIDQIELI